MLLKGKNAVITGANRGIGAAVVRLFASEGANVWACARRDTEAFRAACETLAETYGVFVKPVIFDLGKEDERKAAVKNIKQDKLPIDALVNVAGIVPETRLFQMMSFDELHRVFDVNFFATLAWTQSLSKVMTRQRYGSIVFVSSISALDGEPGQMEYVASKAALVGATRKLASEFGVSGVRVNAVAPGPTKTDMLAEMSEDLRARMTQGTMLGRLAEPQEIAGAIAYLASDLASYVTGQVLRVDGGVKR